MRIKMKEFEYTCGDGCCHEWGVNLFINNQEVVGVFHNEVDALSYVLKKYFKVTIEEDELEEGYRDTFSEYGNYGENNPPVGMSNPGDRDYEC